MIVSELIELLEEFKDDFGDIEVAINRNGREYPVFVRTNGVFPGHTDERQLREYSGYFKYVDDDEEYIDFSEEKVPCPECETTMKYFWRDHNFVCPNCGTEVDENVVRNEFFDIETPNLCILND